MEFVVFGISMPMDDEDEGCSVALYNPDTGSSLNLSCSLDEARTKWHIGDAVKIEIGKPYEYSTAGS